VNAALLLPRSSGGTVLLIHNDVADVAGFPTRNAIPLGSRMDGNPVGAFS